MVIGFDEPRGMAFLCESVEGERLIGIRPITNLKRVVYVFKEHSKDNMTEHFGPITLKWDPKNLEIRTMSVEKTLEPLVLQVK